MPALPNPWISDSAVSPSSAADTAVTLTSPKPGVTANQSPSSTGGQQETPAAVASNPAAAGVTDRFGSDISDVGEIFHFARKLCEPTRFVLDEVAFMEAIEERPLFLRRARG